MGKLVRDKIPAIITGNGEVVTISRINNENDKRKVLLEKLKEEYEELLEAEHPSDILEEICDIVEVLYAYGERHGFFESDIREKRFNKAVSNGIFSNFYILENVSAKEC